MTTNLVNFRELGEKIICAGRNYPDDGIKFSPPIPTEPRLFVKTVNSYLPNGGQILVPEGCKILHYEVELGVVIGKRAKRIRKEDAFQYIGGYAIAMDMTAHDMQQELMNAGLDWYLAKSFDTSCPIGEFVDKSKIKNPQDVEIYCKLNGEIRQKSRTDCMLFDIPTLLEFASKNVTLEPGDLLLTGTPVGAGKCDSGDRLEVGITGITKANFSVA